MAKLSRALAALLAANLISTPLAQATCASGDSARCISRRAPDGSIVQYPRLSWTVIASAARDPSGQGFQIRYLQGGMTRVTRNASASALGISGQQVSGLFYQPPNAPPIVFARFAPGSNQLRIDVLRIERGIDGRIRVADAVFGPHHGERFIAQQDFIAASDVRANRPGLNPLAAWKSPADNIFHDICLECPDGQGGIDAHTSGVAVALGVAMRSVGAHLGILAAAHEWVDVQESSSGGLLRSTVTVKVSGYARPDWWIASPIGAQTAGSSSLGACAVTGESPCRPEHVVAAGIQLAPWAGPGLPTDQDRLYYSESSQSGFTVLGYSLITAALVGFGSYVWGGEMLAADGGAQGIVSSIATSGSVGGVTATSAIGTGLAAGTGYATSSDLLHPGSTNDIQSSYLGTTVGSGQLASQANGSSIEQQLAKKATAAQIDTQLGNALTGEAKLYHGQCADTNSRHQCGNLEQGVVPRTQ